MNGIIPLYKPAGMTSFQCVGKLRHLLQMKKIGHTGTLDPDVDGVLPICVGTATKLSRNLMSHGKQYIGSILLGEATTTEDLSGDIIARQKVTHPIASEKIDQALRKLTQAKLTQIPPMYSAVRVHGRHLYEYARKGQTVVRPKRIVRINAFKQRQPTEFCQMHQQQKVFFKVSCGKGTYVRTLATQVGKILHVPAVMSGLTRVESGGFHLSDTVTFEQIKQALEHHHRSFLRPLDYALPGIKHYALSADQWHRVQHGNFLYNEDVPNKLSEVILQYQGDIKALYRYDLRRTCYVPKIMFSIH